MTWIEPLALQTWIINVFAGGQDIFLAIALFFIFGMTAFFKLPVLGMFIMLALFLLMFNAYVAGNYLLMLIGIFGGLLIGYWLSKTVK